MNRVEHFLRETIGLESAAVGPTLVRRAARLRMSQLGITLIQDYLGALRHSRSEAQELIESVVIPETWFFRDKESFDALGRLAAWQWLSGKSGRALRLLSVPCSSGEEPWSMAMALLAAGIPRHRFRIDAADISSRALGRARKAVYLRNSFRSKDLCFRGRFFRQTAEGFALSPDVRACVTFLHGNLLTEGFLPPPGGYDFIFCRNLLIYFDPQAQRRALEKLDRLLEPHGFLFVGAAEQPIVTGHGFVCAGLPGAFAFRKAGQPANRHAVTSKTPRTRGPLSRLGDFCGPVPAPPESGMNGAARNSANEFASLPSLEDARRLADAGRLEEAAALCQDHLRREKTAAAYYLLGLVRDASGDPSAADCYRRAVYLQPDHSEALLQLAMLSEKQGDFARARALKRRARQPKP